MVEYRININQAVGNNTRFWEAAGLDHLYFLTFRPEGQSLLKRMKNKGSCRYLRNHHVLSSLILDGVQVGGEVYSEDESGNPVYRFEKINAVYKEFLKHGIKPVVEFDYLPDLLSLSGNKDRRAKAEGNPTSEAGPSDWKKWADLLKAFTQNLGDTFGLEEIRTWYFEVWNEPDHWKIEDLPVFFRMYDVFVDAVTSVDDQLRVGGPGCFHEYFLRDFLHHVVNGTNYVTGKKGTRIDFISYHIYGISGGWVDQHPLVQPTVQRFVQEVLWIQRLVDSFPGLGKVEFHLNEWGVCSHYQKTSEEFPALEYRNSEFSPLFLTKLINCLYAIEDIYKFPTSMLLYWGFAWEDYRGTLFNGNRSLTTAGHLPKPIQTGHEMLSMMGEERLKVHGPNPGGTFGVFATRTGIRELQFIVYNFNELEDAPQGEDWIDIRLEGLAGAKCLEMKAYRLDREHHNTYREWQKQGSPQNPEGADMEKLAACAELHCNQEFVLPVEEDGTLLTVSIPRHGMCLFIANLA